MTAEEFRKTMAEVEYIPAGSALHQAFHAFSQEALKITAELNNVYHTPEEVRALMSQLTASEIDESFAMFPPFHSDCGKNTKIGKRVFINAGCQFQDHCRAADDHRDIEPRSRPGEARRNDSQASRHLQQGVARRTGDGLPGGDNRRRRDRRLRRGSDEGRPAAHRRRRRSGPYHKGIVRRPYFVK